MNPFDILGDDDNEDPSQLVAAVNLDKMKKAPATAQQGKPAAKMPSKPLPPAQAGEFQMSSSFFFCFCCFRRFVVWIQL